MKNIPQIPETLTVKLFSLGPHFIKVRGKGKEPVDPGWPLNPMVADDPKITEWLAQGGNYGVVGGYGIVIVDVDNEDLKAIVKEKLPKTFTVQSPGSKGWHLYFISSLEKPIRLRDKEGENIGDIQGQGKMVVGPGSTHPNGGVYQIVDDRPLAQVTREQLLEAFKEYVVPDREIEQVEAMARQEKRSNINLAILQVVPLSRLHRRGNEYYGSHPVHSSKTGQNFWVNPSKNVWHCFRHGTGGGPLLWLAVEEGLVDCAEAGPGALRGELFKEARKIAVERGLIKEEKTKPAITAGNYFDGDGKFIPALLAEELLGEYHFATMMDSKEIYVYLDGYYQPLGEVLIKRECKRRLGDEYRKNRAGEVTDYVEASTYVKRREESPNLLPLNNGVLDINTMELKPHAPELMFFNKLPMNYNAEADCPEIKKFHKEIVNSEQDIKVLEEAIGYCLYRGYPIHKALMVVGGGANGKSTWLSLVRTFLGPQNVSGRNLFELEEVRFARADLFGKYANIYADLPDRALQRTGMFKMLTGADQLAAEKKFRDSFHFINYAKLLFSANKVPEAMDDTDAFFRRWIIITFPNVFNGKNCDPRKLEKITTEEELSGLLNLALSTLKTLLNNGDFSHMKTTDEIREDYIRKSSPIASFVMDCLEVDSDAFIEKKELFNVFAAYCRSRGIPCVTQTTFFKNLPQHVAVTDIRASVEKNRVTAFKGIRYSDGVSSVSSVSRVFYTLIEQAKNFKAPWKVVELNDPSYIKIEITLDTPDTPDAKEASAPQTTLKRPCEICDSPDGRLHIIPGQGEKWLCDRCLRDYEGNI